MMKFGDPASYLTAIDEVFNLFQLQDTKSNDRCTTFLHYLADMIQSRLPDVDNFYEDFDLEAGTKGMLSFIFLFISFKCFYLLQF